MRKKSDDKIVEETYQAVAENIQHKDYEIIEFKAYIQDDYVYDIIEYYKNNISHRKVIKNKWRW